MRAFLFFSSVCLVLDFVSIPFTGGGSPEDVFLMAHGEGGGY